MRCLIETNYFNILKNDSMELSTRKHKITNNVQHILDKNPKFS